MHCVLFQPKKWYGICRVCRIGAAPLVLFPMTLTTPKFQIQTTPFSTFCIAFHFIVVFPGWLGHVI